MKAKEIYSQIYKMTDNLTPLLIDCGQLCDGACCKDSGEGDSGMYLYYGEEVMYNPVPEFMKIEESDFCYGEDNRRAKICICKGKCDRTLRPLSCRIFPLVPYKKPGVPLHIIMDPRAKAMCPMAKTMSPEEFDPKFTETVAYIFKVLVKNKRIRDFIIEQSYLLDEYMKFY